MKLNLLKRNKEEEQEVKPVGKKIKKEQIIENEKTPSSLLQIPVFSQYNALMKLRIVVSTIFLLCTIAVIILIFVNDWTISAILLLLGYILLFILLLKLFRIKKL